MVEINYVDAFDEEAGNKIMRITGSVVSSIIALAFAVSAKRSTTELIQTQVMLNAPPVDINDVDSLNDGDYIKISGYTSTDGTSPLKSYRTNDNKTHNALVVTQRYTEISINTYTYGMAMPEKQQKVIQEISKQVPLFLGKKGNDGIISPKIPVGISTSALEPLSTVIESNFHEAENTESKVTQVVRFLFSSQQSIGVRVDTLAVFPSTKVSMIATVKENQRSQDTDEPKMELRWPTPSPFHSFDFKQGYVHKGSIEDMEDELILRRNDLALWSTVKWGVAGFFGYWGHKWWNDSKQYSWGTQ